MRSFSRGTFPLGTSGTMTLVLALALLAADPPEDAAHRADRLRTEQLNRAAAAVGARRDQRNADAQADYRAAQVRYEAEMAAWRRRVAACQAGDRASCRR
jgi:hypothetical protein